MLTLELPPLRLPRDILGVMRFNLRFVLFYLTPYAALCAWLVAKEMPGLDLSDRLGMVFVISLMLLHIWLISVTARKSREACQRERSTSPSNRPARQEED